MVSAAGERASYRFVEFFTAQIRNPNTRRAYHTDISQFFLWCHSQNLQLHQIHSIHVATYVEQLQQHVSAPTVKQHMAAIRKLFDWLVVGHVLETNPSQAVRGPKYVVKRGKTPILTPEDTRALFDSIPMDTLIGLRDRALLAVMVYSFARVDAAAKMRVKDYYPNGKRWWIRLHEKGGKHHEMPAHHTLEQYLDEYIEAAGIRDDPKGDDNAYVESFFRTPKYAPPGLAKALPRWGKPVSGCSSSCSGTTTDTNTAKSALSHRHNVTTGKARPS